MSRPVLIAPVALLATPFVALAVAVPPALRIAGERTGVLEAWLAAAALMCPLLGFSIVLARAARRALSTMAGGTWAPWWVGAAIWTVTSLPATAVLGAWLKTHTHHRGLGGATFAALSLGIYAATALLAWRVTPAAVARVPRDAAPRWLAITAATVFLLVLVAAVYGLMGIGPQPAGSRAAALLLDGALAFVGIAVAATLDLPPPQSSDASRLGAGATIFILAVGVALAVRSPTLARQLDDRAPLARVVSRIVGLSEGARRPESIQP